jgi:hypothetical protein
MNGMEPTLTSDNVSTRCGLVLERIRAGAIRLDLDDLGAWDEDERVRRLGLPVMWQRGRSGRRFMGCSGASHPGRPAELLADDSELRRV